MYTTSPVQPFDEKNDENHDDGGNKKVYKWKMLVEKHKDDLRKLWDNKSKWQKLVRAAHIKNAKRFAYTMYGVMILITFLYYATRYLSNESIDLYMFLPVLLLYIMAVTWSRLLVMGNRIKYHIMIMITIKQFLLKS